MRSLVLLVTAWCSWVVNTQQGALLAAWCTARCLIGNNDSPDTNCSLPCEAKLNSLAECDLLCRNSGHLCEDSCSFLIHTFEKCGSCSFEEPCCSSLDDADLPPIPINVTLHERHVGRVVQVTWLSSGYDEPRDSVMNVVQMRWKVGPFSNATMSDWETLTQTTAETVILKEVLFPGRWYQFRVAAVSGNGSRGFSEDSTPFILSVPPRSPGPPQNLREYSPTADGYPVIKWEPPVSDLPIQQYKVSWMQRMRGIHMRHVYPRESYRLVPANRLMFTLKQVESSSLYHVQVQSVTLYGNRTILGEKATIYVKTFSLARTMDGTSQPPSLTVSRVYEDDDNLHANATWQMKDEGSKSNYVVKWKPISCSNDKKIDRKSQIQHTTITKDAHIKIKNLVPDCEYEINVHLQSDPDLKASTTFSVPSCRQLTKGKINTPLCRNNKDERPSNMTESQPEYFNRTVSTEINLTIALILITLHFTVK